MHGDLVLAEPEARKIAEALAEKAGCEVEVRRHPPRLADILDDLCTLSLFSSAKVILAVDTAALADRSAAADLIDDAEKALPVGEGELPNRSRQGASRLLQALRLYGVDPMAGTPAQAIDALPAEALAGGNAVRRKKPRGRGKKDAQALAEGLAELLGAAREAGIHGWAEGDLARLSSVVSEGLPPGHALVLAEPSVETSHPVVRALAERKAVKAVGGVTSDRRKGWQGLDAVAGQLEEETGVGITRDAFQELVRRTLRQERRGGAAEAESTARLAGEYRKLANLAQGKGKGKIDRSMVGSAVDDRGEEDVWKLLDAIGAGRGGEALERMGRLLGSSDDPMGARLGFFSLLASLARHITAIRSMMRLNDVPAGVGNYKTFESRWASRLQGDLPGGAKSPLAGLKPYRLFKAYQAACAVPEDEAALLPWAVLETELRLKGESDDPDAALSALVIRLSRRSAGGGSGGRGPGPGGFGSRGPDPRGPRLSGQGDAGGRRRPTWAR